MLVVHVEDNPTRLAGMDKTDEGPFYVPNGVRYNIYCSSRPLQFISSATHTHVKKFYGPSIVYVNIYDDFYKNE
jgi:hypothetical protein